VGRVTLVPKSLEGQMVVVLALALLALFAALMILEVTQHQTALQAAESELTQERITRLYPVLEGLDDAQLPAILNLVSSCHAGHTVTDAPFQFDHSSAGTEQLSRRIAQALSLDPRRVLAGHAHLTREDFAYWKCSHSEIDLPIDGIVIALRLGSGKWLNAEVHPHEWHIREKLDWILRATGVFVLVGGIAIFFMHRLSKPLGRLTTAAQRFGAGLEVSTLEEDGPADLRRAIRSFNTMQREVTDEIERRTNTLAAISHDVRTPLTALRVKAELIEDTQVREDLISSINRMEEITASALEFLRGESRNEAMRSIDLSALLESECADFEEVGRDVQFMGEHGIQHTCRPDALARAVRNLIDNAVKYAGGAKVSASATAGLVEIRVSDDGPGIPADQMALAMEPFVRLSAARESGRGGFGLGLATARAIAEGHDGELSLSSAHPKGLTATVRMPRR
jgi:signal transduction histidine kinase